MKDEKKDAIINNYINGNLSDFRAALHKCSKLDLLDLIEWAQGQYGIRRHQMINRMRLDLEI